MLESFKGKELTYTKLTEEEQKQRGILGRLTGIIADGTGPTRNGRKYSTDLWEKVFNSPLMQEKIKTRTCFGELGHPLDDRTETKLENIAVCLAEQPKLGDDGKLYGVFDILDTPNGRILKTLCDYNSNLGISSRGSGSLITDPDTGEEMVDPDTYDCECWDIVLLPAVESARLSYVNESLGKHENVSKPNLVTALRESLDKASVDDKRVMEATLKDLGIDISSPQETSVTLTESGTLKQTEDEPKEAADSGSDELIKSLQEALKAKTELEAKVQSLQEQLAVSNTKVDSLNEECSRYKSVAVRLSSVATSKKSLAEKVSTLEEELKVKQKTIDSLTQENKTLVESKQTEEAKATKTLTESVSVKDAEIKSLNENLASKDAEIVRLTEELDKEKSESSKKLEETTTQLSKQTQLKEEYKKLALDASNRYIASKAVMLGVTEEEIKHKLPAKYSFDDVDRVCESLQEYALNIRRLPFSVDRKVKTKVNESTSSLPICTSPDIMDDDAVSESLLRMSRKLK